VGLKQKFRSVGANLYDKLAISFLAIIAAAWPETDAAID
jgi:hypothetical protein